MYIISFSIKATKKGKHNAAVIEPKDTYLVNTTTTKYTQKDKSLIRACKHYHGKSGEHAFSALNPK